MHKDLYRYLRTFAQRLVYGNVNAAKFGARGEDVSIGPDLVYANENNIFIGSHVSIGMKCVLYAARAEIHIGDYVLFGPGVTIVTGNHRTDLVGEYMYQVRDDMKLPGNDAPVVIRKDVWIGANVTILKGVTIGEGSVIAAGQVVSHDVEPYTIYLGNQNTKKRFSDEEITEHKWLLAQKYGNTDLDTERV